MTLIEILRTAMGIPMPPPDVSAIDESERNTPLSNNKLSAEEFRSTLARAEGGDTAACCRVGFLYYRGLGVRANYPQAFKWLTLAAEKNDAQAIEGLKVLMLGMTPDDLAQGRRLVARFKGEPEPDFSEPEESFESPEELTDLTTSPERDQVSYGFSAWQPAAQPEEILPKPSTKKLPTPAPRTFKPAVPPQSPVVRPAPVAAPIRSARPLRWAFVALLLVLAGAGTWYYWDQIQGVANSGGTSKAGSNATASVLAPVPATGANAAVSATNLAVATTPTNQDRRSFIQSLQAGGKSGPPGSPPAATGLPPEKLAEQAARGSADAQFLLGLNLAERKDYTNAVLWFTKAAEQGQADAQNNLAICYIRGSGVTKDYVQAYKWISLAIAGGNRDALPNRDRLARMMSPAEMQEAKRLTVEFVNRLPTNTAAAPAGTDNKPVPPQ